MPTPSSSSHVPLDLSATTVPHATCPPDDDRSVWRSEAMEDSHEEVDVPVSATPQLLNNSPPSSQPAGSTETHITQQRIPKRIDMDEEASASEMLSPMSTEGEKHDERDLQVLARTDMGSSSMGYDFSNIRLIPYSPSCFLRAGSKYTGTQKSERQVYEVQVDIKHVDMRESFLCGYLRIKGLTEDHPTLTTYFEGEIIGSKYSFLTQHQDWGSTDKVDLQHWAKFNAFRPYRENAKKGHFHIREPAQKENIFMRWKEHFLVPDHRVRTISGASFEGFYYICFNQIQGTVSGVYFHAKSERFQQLELKHVEDRGCFASMEFR